MRLTRSVKEGGLLAKLRVVLPGFILLKPFIKRFAKTTQVIAQVMKILKTRGLIKPAMSRVINY